MPDFGKLADENRGKIEQGVEKAVDAGEKKTGKKAPSQLDDKVDGIDPNDGDGGAGDGGPADDSRDRERSTDADRSA